MKFRKKPVVVEAVQWFPGKPVAGVAKEEIGTATKMNPSEVRFYVTTIHGQRAYLSRYDWVITERDGVHHYPCKPDIFEATYEPVEG